MSLNVVSLLDLVNQLHRRFEEGPLVLKGLRRDEQIPEVVGHHPLRSMLGWIDAHDGELLAADFGNTRPDDAAWLLQIRRFTLLRLRIRLTMFAAARSGFTGHLDSPYWGKWDTLTFSPTAIQAALSSPKRVFLSVRHHT